MNIFLKMKKQLEATKIYLINFSGVNVPYLIFLYFIFKIDFLTEYFLYSLIFFDYWICQCLTSSFFPQICMPKCNYFQFALYSVSYDRLIDHVQKKPRILLIFPLLVNNK